MPLCTKPRPPYPSSFRPQAAGIGRDSSGTGREGRRQGQAYMMPRMDPRTQLKCDRGEWGYRYRLVRMGGGSGLFSVGPHRLASLPLVVRSTATIARKTDTMVSKTCQIGSIPSITTKRRENTAKHRTKHRISKPIPVPSCQVGIG
jgi:hypothetical protein